jgi:hypothetical protein
MLNKLKLKNNYLFKSGLNFNINLDQNFDNQISLKNFIKNRLGKVNLINDFKLTFTIASNQSFVVNDNLFDLGIFSSNIEFVLNEGSSLDYVLKTEALKTCKDFCGDCLRCLDVEKINKALSFKFIGQNSSANIKLSINGAGSYLFDIKTLQDHQASNTKSDLRIKSALSQNSFLKSDNLVKVAPDLKNVKANQLNKNLLMSCSPRVICLPKLEVESDDVECKHGAAISKIDEEQLFYLKSRGIDYCKAREILVNAFLN